MNDIGSVTITINSADGIASFGGVEIKVNEGVSPANIRAAIIDAINQQNLGVAELENALGATHKRFSEEAGNVYKLRSDLAAMTARAEKAEYTKLQWESACQANRDDFNGVLRDRVAERDAARVERDAARVELAEALKQLDLDHTIKCRGCGKTEIIDDTTLDAEWKRAKGQHPSITRREVLNSMIRIGKTLDRHLEVCLKRKADVNDRYPRKANPRV